MLVINNIRVTLTDLEGKVDTKYVNEHGMNFKCSNHITRVNKTLKMFHNLSMWEHQQQAEAVLLEKLG